MKLNSMTAKMFNAALTVLVLTGSVAFAQSPINRKPLTKGLNPSATAQPGVNNGSTTTTLPIGGPITNAPCGVTSVIWDNGPFNSVNGLSSEQNTQVANSRTADDFVVATSTTVNQVTADIFATPGETTLTGNLDIFPTETTGNGPSNTAPAIVSVTSTNFTVVGTGFGFDVRRYVFTIANVTFSPGRYWVNPYLSGTGTGRAFFCTSNGATPSAEQVGYIRSVDFNAPNWTLVTDPAFNNGPNFAFTVRGCAAVAGPVNVNSQVNFQTTQQNLGGVAPAFCTGLGYNATQYNLNVTLTNIGTNTFTSPFYQVVELQAAGGVAPALPFRLRTADDFNGAACSGGLVGSTQAIAASMPPQNAQATNFQIVLPAVRRFRFIVNVFATIGSVGNNRTTSPVKMGQLAVEATGFDKAGNPILSSVFTPENGVPSFAVNRVSGTVKK